MAKFTANPDRYDPYRGFKFGVKIDNLFVAGLSKCSALKRTTEMVEWREGGDPSTTHKLPGKTKYEPITLTAGVTHDPTFEAWANLVNNLEGDAAMSLKNFRKNIVLNVLNLQGQVAISYKLNRAWVSDYCAPRGIMPALPRRWGFVSSTTWHWRQAKP